MIDIAEFEEHDRPAVRVTTVDATGGRRIYEVHLAPSEVNGAIVSNDPNLQDIEGPEAVTYCSSRRFDSAVPPYGRVSG